MIVFWKKKDILLGDQNVSEITVLEWKKLFSIKLFHFHKTEGSQDRFHTHAFNALSFLLKGNYTEEVLDGKKVLRLPRNRSKIIFIPKGQFHRITKSEGCRTLLITGPWDAEWSELRHIVDSKYQEVVQTTHRVDLRIGHVIELEGLE